MKIGIGTAQFGLDYGISNKAGITPPEEVTRILNTASDLGIRVIDTAPLYGCSEEVLGLSRPDNFDIVTKTPHFTKQCITHEDAHLLEETFMRSLSKLRQASIYGLLIHRAEDLLSPGGHLLMEKMLELKGKGLVTKIGVSVYSGQQIDRILDRYRIGLIQLPISVLDQRLLAGSHLKHLEDAQIEIHARSAFLQGLLLMEPGELPRHFDSIRKHLKEFRDFLEKNGMTPIEALLGYLTGLGEIDTVLCGVNHHHQLEQIAAAVHKDFDYSELARFAIEDESILDPSKWHHR